MWGHWHEGERGPLACTSSIALRAPTNIRVVRPRLGETTTQGVEDWRAGKEVHGGARGSKGSRWFTRVSSQSKRLEISG
eukprot:2829574-Pyramimonas_sp.AAC.1